jgi:hypothetical protein
MLALCYRWHHVATALRRCPGFHTFGGPFVEASGRELFVASAEGLRHIVSGYRLLRQWATALGLYLASSDRYETRSSSVILPLRWSLIFWVISGSCVLLPSTPII